MHCLLAYIAMLLGPLCWHSFTIHTIYLILICSSAIYSGGTFYFRVFAKKYMANVLKIESESLKANPTAVVDGVVDAAAKPMMMTSDDRAMP